jgi:hypothetical protein
VKWNASPAGSPGGAVICVLCTEISSYVNGAELHITSPELEHALEPLEAEEHGQEEGLDGEEDTPCQWERGPVRYR